MSQLSFEELLQKYINQTCSPAEVDQLFELFEKGEGGAADNELLKQHFQQGLQPTGYTNDATRRRLQGRLGLIKQQIAPEPIAKRRSLVGWWAAAAAITLLVGCGIWYWLVAEKQAAPAVHQEAEVQPGSDKAVLTLADGKTISLDSSTQGIIGRQGQTDINQRGAQLIYDASNASSGSAIYNTLSTPRGAQYQLTLPDGSTVWLNAASSIRFPAVFNDSARVVYITGEVYFEVSKQANKNGNRVPFNVIIPGAEIKVLGTHFNINAYEDEDVARTTLLEGEVKVVKHEMAKNAESSVVLKPGEQAVLSRAHSPLTTHHSPLTIDHSPNLEQVMAWKNGLFRFDGVELKTMMRQLARWYNVEVTFAPGAPVSELFNGAIQRSLQLSQVLTGMDAMGIHVKREGKQLIVMP
ncbi:FecR domain-containing protein [Niastella sp. OAS944]|uniref:FecR family protein n=1 Tax=Niastella sp. OAS944 TaxID=2664089 RepID=UPI00346C05D0|nr:ferric-dicitrate binding protein FerR (iron transport regulator) [Chitinophagaceae bacterium OAS944]